MSDSTNVTNEQKPERKKVLLSGIQPTGTFTLGNYIGAVRNWEKLQDEYDCAYFIADLHSLTVRQEPADLRKHSKEAFALLLACGIDPERTDHSGEDPLSCTGAGRDLRHYVGCLDPGRTLRCPGSPGGSHIFRDCVCTDAEGHCEVSSGGRDDSLHDAEPDL